MAQVIYVNEIGKLLDQPHFMQNDRIPEDRNDFIGKDISSCQQAHACRAFRFEHDVVGVERGVAACMGAWAQFTLTWCCR